MGSTLGNRGEGEEGEGGETANGNRYWLAENNVLRKRVRFLGACKKKKYFNIIL